MESNFYKIIDRIKLEQILECLHICLGLHIQALDESGTPLCSFGTASAFCMYFKKLLSKYLFTNNSCRELHASAAMQALSLGEPYIFSCHAGLNHIVYPLVSDHTLYGSILVGPFLMEASDSGMIFGISKQYSFSLEDSLNLFESASTISIISAQKATEISRLLAYTFAPLVSDGCRQLTLNHDRETQQSSINESIQLYKKLEQNKKNAYPIDKERLLISEVKKRNSAEAKQILNELLGYVLYDSGNNLDIIRSRSAELCALLSRASIEGGANPAAALRINNEFMQNIYTTATQDGLCLQLQKTVNYFIESMFVNNADKNREVIKTAITYINEKYHSPLTLSETAAHVHLNASYFSTLFKQICGASFKEYLNCIRVEESKNLLSGTGYSILEIAVAVGFENQSYFTKVFKKYTGMTPKQYRN